MYKGERSLEKIKNNSKYNFGIKSFYALDFIFTIIRYMYISMSESSSSEILKRTQEKHEETPSKSNAAA